MITVSFIIPSYNESKNLFKLCNKLDLILKNYDFIEIIIVNNGSTDQTEKIIKNHKIYNKKKFKILSIKKNIGYGHGIMSGIKIANGKIIAWFHADLQLNPTEVLNAVIKYKKSLLNDELIVKGVRKNRNIFDNIFTYLMAKFVNVIFKTSVNDINAQPKIFNKNILKKFKNPPKDFSLDLYFLLIAYFSNYQIVEFPIFWGKRYSGIAKGGGNLIGKIKLTIRSLSFIINLKKKWK